MDRLDNPLLSEKWLDALNRAEADVAAGRTVSGEIVLRRLRRTLADMEARAINEQPVEAIRRR